MHKHKKNVVRTLTNVCVGYHIHESVFLQEVKQFEALRSGVNSLTIDPGWLSTLCSILW
jgi:hypothetical protein